MQFDYMYTMTAEDSIEIEDIGNFCLSVTNDLYLEWIMMCTTTYGITTYLQAGPFRIDFDELDDRVVYVFQRMEYNQGKLCKLIDSFINDDKKRVTQVSLISEDKAKSSIKDLVRGLYEQQ